MRRANRILAWIGWITLWTFGTKFLALAGMIEERKFLWIVIEAVLCCAAACLMTQSKLITVVTLVIMTVKFVLDINIVSVFWYAMAILLWWLTLGTRVCTSEQKQQSKTEPKRKCKTEPKKGEPEPKPTKRVKLK